MSQQNINIGSSANKGDGDPLRTAFTKINSNFTELYGKVIVLEGGGVAIQRDTQGSIFGDDSTLLVDAVNSLIPSSVLSGNLPALDGSALTNLTIPAQTFASLTSKPTTVSGYGITDALALGTTSTTALAGDTALFDGVFASLTSKPTTIAGYGITDALASTGAVDFTGATSVDFTGATVTGLSVSGLQSRIIRTNTTSSLADGAEADLDITGFKAYTLMAITTGAAARVRLYVKAASRTADAARAEGTDPTSDAGLIAEVITTGAETVIISPGAYGFNLEPITTTNIACRVTNKSGSTDSVQVSLVILQLEA